MCNGFAEKKTIEGEGAHEALREYASDGPDAG